MYNTQIYTLFFTTKISVCTDDELLSRFRNNGNADCFTELYSRYIPLSYGLCLNYLKTEAEAQDAVMELFEELRHKAAKYEIRTFRTWLYSVVKNHCLKRIRDNKQPLTVEFNQHFMEFADFPALFNEDDKEANFHTLRQCLEKLPEPQRVSVELFFQRDLSYADIVETTGYQLKSVKSYIQNGKRNLKICMDNEK